MNKRIAILYDYDLTLTPKYMQEYGLMQFFGYNNVKEYYINNENICCDPEMDKSLSLLGGILIMTKEKGIKLTREFLQNFGKDIEYFPGVEEWFDKINAYGASLGYEVEHYVISTGSKELIEGSSIAKHFKRIYSNFYAYKDGEAFWPSQVVNYTSKTQYIYRVRKNVLDDLSSWDKVNEKMDDSEMLPFRNIIYIGDSQTDIPCFKIIKNSGGMSICVHNNSESSLNTAHKCFEEDRVNEYFPADYTENGELFGFIKKYIKKIAGKL